MTDDLQELGLNSDVGGSGYIDLVFVSINNIGVGLELHFSADREKVGLLVGELEGKSHGGGESDVEYEAVVQFGVVKVLAVLQTSGGSFEG